MNYVSGTTIQIDKETRERLSGLKSSERDTYDEVLNKLIDLIPSGDDEGAYSDEFKASLLRGISNIKNGNTVSLNDFKKRVGMNK